MNGQQSDSMVTASNNNNKTNKINNNNNIIVWAGMDSNPTGRGGGSPDFFSQPSSGELSLNRCTTNTGRHDNFDDFDNFLRVLTITIWPVDRPSANPARNIIKIVTIWTNFTDWQTPYGQLTNLLQTLPKKYENQDNVDNFVAS